MVKNSQNCQKKVNIVNCFMKWPFYGFILLFQPFNCQNLFLKHLKSYIILSALLIQVLPKHIVCPKGSHQNKKNGQTWEFVPTGGREVYPDPNLLTGFKKCSNWPETYYKHKNILYYL